jgi:hypothetical protein
VECKSKYDPAVTVSTGTISKSFRKYQSNTWGKQEIEELQKTSLLGTAHYFEKY